MDSGQPVGLDFFGPTDQAAGHASLRGDLDEAIAVGGGRGTHHEHQLGALRQLLDGILPILGRVADVIPARQLDLGKTFLERRHDIPGVIHGKGGLGDAAQSGWICHLEFFGFLDCFDQMHSIGRLPHRPFYFHVPRVTDHDDLEPRPLHAMHFLMDLGDQGAGGVEGSQATLGCRNADRRRDAMSAENQARAGLHIFGFFDEDRAFRPQIIHHPLVVDDLVAHVDRFLVSGDASLDNLDCPVDTSAKTPGIRENNFHGRQSSDWGKYGPPEKVFAGETLRPRYTGIGGGFPSGYSDRRPVPGIFLGGEASGNRREPPVAQNAIQKSARSEPSNQSRPIRAVQSELSDQREWKAMHPLTPEERFLRSCRGDSVDRPPVWLMRQAGRYLPEYRALRAGVGFREMCEDVDRAVAVSLQPLDVVGSEAVILFQDIFTPVPGMGADLDFAPGPVMAEPIRSRAQVDALRVPDPRESVPFVFEILSLLRAELKSRAIPLLGFAGAPFTLAAYMVEGSGSRDFSILKRMLHREPDLLRALLRTLTEMTIGYLDAQIEAGAQAVQIFDTWAGLLSPSEYGEWVLPSHQQIVERVTREGAPIILYVKNGGQVVDPMVDSGADVISLDWRVPLGEVARRYGDRISLQGNLDPCALTASPERIAEMVAAMAHEASSARGYIANLGHGCLPDTPVEGVRAFIESVKALA